jgi:nicotinamidase-related amidase
MSTGNERAPASRTLEPGRRPALLIVDFVRAYLLPGSPLYAGVENARTAAERLLAFARAAGIPVFHTNVVYEPGGRDGGVFFRKLPALASFERGAHPELAAFAEGLEPHAGSGSASSTRAHSSAHHRGEIARLDIDTVLIAGVSTSGCVRATAVDAQSGFVPLVVRDAVGDRHPAPPRQNRLTCRRNAEVISLGAAEQYLRRLCRIVVS